MDAKINITQLIQQLSLYEKFQLVEALLASIKQEERISTIVKEEINDGKGILQSAGVMTEDEAAEMYDALADTENIDEDGW
ncbi:MAG: hypothetical protein AB8G22_05765 [Saprospiraceae bacterium]